MSQGKARSPGDTPMFPSPASSSSEAGTEAKACWKACGSHLRDRSGADLCPLLEETQTCLLARSWVDMGRSGEGAQEMPLKFSIVLYWHGILEWPVNMSCMWCFGVVMLTELPDVLRWRCGARLWRPYFSALLAFSPAAYFLPIAKPAGQAMSLVQESICCVLLCKVHS